MLPWSMSLKTVERSSFNLHIITIYAKQNKGCWCFIATGVQMETAVNCVGTVLEFCDNV